MIGFLRNITGILYRAGYNGIIKHDGIEHAGYLAFLALLALFPFLVLIVSLAGFFGQGEIGTRFVELMFTNLPAEAVSALRPRIAEIVGGPPQGFLTVAILGAMWTSSSMVEGMRTVLNRAYHVHTPPAYWLRRLLSIAQLLIIIAIILVVMTIFVFTPFLIGKMQTIFALKLPDDHSLGWSRFIFFVSATTLFLMVSYLYFVLPNIKQSILSVAPGALVTVLLWLEAASLLTSYLENFDQVNLIYGSLGSFIATLLFFYIMNIIFIFGAELNYELKIAMGAKIVEKQGN